MSKFVDRTLPLTLFVVGFALVVVGVLYLVTPVEALPSFLGGIHHGRIAYHTKRADATLILGVISLAVSTWLFRRSIARVREHRYLPLDPHAIDDRTTEEDLV